MPRARFFGNALLVACAASGHSAAETRPEQLTPSHSEGSAGTRSSADRVAAAGTATATRASNVPYPYPYPIREHAWQRTGLPAIRGTTVGPIENQLHPDRGYGSAACARTMHEIRRMGGNWVSITPFGRVYNLEPTGISMRFEAPFEQNRKAVSDAIAQAHAEGLKVLLVPHLWVETGAWRGEIDPKSDAGWARWAKAYGDFAAAWAKV
ncbi:MAG TPA: hypothetical protein VIV60_25500, partial [Polyangiaceae bacterium]